jgi:hypothetical protein
LSTADFLLDFHQAGLEGKSWGTIQPASSMNLATLEELVFLHCKYYSIFLLQQEASALAMKYSYDKQQWYLNSFFLGVKL